jgi:hypothetical protein
MKLAKLHKKKAPKKERERKKNKGQANNPKEVARVNRPP